MNFRLRYVVLFCFAALLAAQIIRPVKNSAADGPGPDALVRKYAVPADVQRVLAKACNDCHSNQTRYPWYAEVQPVGWWLAHHVDEGKAHLDFSTFGRLDSKQAARQLEKLGDEITDGTMPLKSYTWIHTDARLTEAEKTLVLDWAEALGEKLRTP